MVFIVELTSAFWTHHAFWGNYFVNARAVNKSLASLLNGGPQSSLHFFLCPLVSTVFAHASFEFDPLCTVGALLSLVLEGYTSP